MFPLWLLLQKYLAEFHGKISRFINSAETIRGVKEKMKGASIRGSSLSFSVRIHKRCPLNFWTQTCSDLRITIGRQQTTGLFISILFCGYFFRGGEKGRFFFHFNLDCAITLSYQEIVIFIYLFHQKSNEYGHEHLILNSWTFLLLHERMSNVTCFR